MNSFRRQRRSVVGQQRRGLLRRLITESLEKRDLFASDVFEHHNFAVDSDVNADFKITPLDALIVINQLNNSGPQSLVGVPRLSNFIDVDADNQLTPSDALIVINALNGGQAEVQTLANLQLDVTRNNVSILTNQQGSVAVGDEFDLEVQWLDTRQTKTGLFAVYADILANNSDKFIPVVGETHVIQFTDQVTGGKIVLTANGKTAELTPVQLATFEDVFTAYSDTLGFGADNIRVNVDAITLNNDANFPGAKQLKRTTVTFVGANQVLKDIPDVQVDSSQLTFAQGVTPSVVFKASTTQALLNENGDGTISPNEINPAAILANIDSTTRSIVFRTGGAPAGLSVYTNGRAGAYQVTAPVVDGFQELFNEVGGFGGLTNIPTLGRPPFQVNLNNAFEAYSLKLRAIAPTTSGSPVTFKVDKSDTSGRETLLYDIAYQTPEFNIPNKNDFIAIDPVKGTVNLTFTAANVFAAVDDTATINEDAAATSINVIANDTNPGGGALNVTAFTQPANTASGVVSIANNQIVFTPSKDFNNNTSNPVGPTTFTYTVTNAANQTRTATVTVNITPVNDAPTALDKSVSTPQGQQVTITEATLLQGATAGPSDEKEAISVSAVGTASSGRANVTFTQSPRAVTYTPEASFTGPTDTFTYTVTDGNLTVTKTVTVTITAAAAVNAVDDAATVDGGSTNNAINVLANDTPAGALTVTNVTNVSSGNATIATDGKSILFTPAANSPGTVTFTYTASNGANTDTATVTVTVNALNPAPNARNDTFSSIEQGSGANSLNVLINDDGGTGGENDPITITAVTQPSNGTVAITNNGQRISFTPTALGSGSFTYTITDSANKTATATVTVQVIAPVRPRAVGDEFSTPEETPITLNVSQLLTNDLANTGQTILLDTISTSQTVNGGTITVDTKNTADNSDDSVTFTPAKDFNGPATFTYLVKDTGGTATNVAAATGTVTITVTPVNDPPVPVNDQLGPINEDPTSPFDIPFSSLTGNDSTGAANENQTLTVTLVSPETANAGTVTIVGNAVRYTPAPDFNGAFVFNYTVSDQQSANATAIGKATVTVTAVNDNPIAVGDTVTVAEDPANPLVIPVGNLTQNDSRGPATALDEVNQTLSITAVRTPSAQGGTVELVGSNVQYRPATNFFGTDTFTYTLSDGAGGTATGTVTVNVTSVNDPPTAGNDTAQVLQDQSITIARATLLANDSAGPANENQTLTITAVDKLSAAGTVVLNSDGSITYTPPAGAKGISETFQYTVTDGVASATAQVTVTVSAFQPSSVSGSLFIDSNGNGVKESSEQPLGGVKLVLTGNGVTRTTTSDSQGRYEFANLAPGTYTVAYAPASAVDTGNATTSFNFTVGTQGGSNVTGQLFTAKSLSPSSVEMWNLMVTNYIIRQADNGVQFDGGLTIQTDATGGLLFYRSEGGFAGAERVTAFIDPGTRNVTLRVLTTDGRILESDVPNDQKLVLKAKDGTYLIRIFGGLSSLPFTQIASRAQNAAAFEAAVDQIFGA